MIFADKILISLYTSTKYSETLLSQLVAQQKLGEDICELEDKYIILIKWIQILQNYYNYNFDSAADNIVSVYPCITQVQIEELMAKLKIAIGNNKYPLTNIFQLGIWFEELGFYWDDNLTWYDTPPLA